MDINVVSITQAILKFCRISFISPDRGDNIQNHERNVI